jgi:hypothetical protein
LTTVATGDLEPAIYEDTPLVSQHLLQLLDLPGGLVVGFKGRATADRVVKFYLSVGNRSRDTFIFARITDQGSGFVVEGREYVVAIFVGVNAAPIEVICLLHHAPVIEAANRHVMERAFSFDIAGDSSFVNDCPRADSAIDFCQGVTNSIQPRPSWETPQMQLEPRKT